MAARPGPGTATGRRLDDLIRRGSVSRVVQRKAVERGSRRITGQKLARNRAPPNPRIHFRPPGKGTSKGLAFLLSLTSGFCSLVSGGFQPNQPPWLVKRAMHTKTAAAKLKTGQKPGSSSRPAHAQNTSL